MGNLPEFLIYKMEITTLHVPKVPGRSTRELRCRARYTEPILQSRGPMSVQLLLSSIPLHVGPGWVTPLLHKHIHNVFT